MGRTLDGIRHRREFARSNSPREHPTLSDNEVCGPYGLEEGWSFSDVEDILTVH
jgi:hypothetical protein